MIERLVIVGAGGDLTSRYLLPALAQLHAGGYLPERLQVVGAGRHDWSDQQFRRYAQEALTSHGDGMPDGFAARLSWQRADATDPEQLAELVGGRHGPAVLYLALPPSIYPQVVAALEQVGPPAHTRLVVEKPFGSHHRSARELNVLLRRVLPEESLFRVDHFLAKQTVLNLLGLRFANRIFDPVWNHAHLARVEIIWDETIGVAGRAGYYDRAGALRDMLQNHLLQLLALVAMEPPVGLGERDLRDRKLDVLRATRVATGAEADLPYLRARYTAGTAGGVALPDYVEEPGVDPDRQTETFAEITLLVENWRWAGVPFVLRAGKGLACDRTEVALHFRPVPHSPFPDRSQGRPNVLRLLIDPERINVGINLNGAGDPFVLEPASLELALAAQELPAYARLLLDILDGDPTWSIRGDEAEEAWRIVEPVLSRWQAGELPLREYPAGSTGPAGSRVGGAT